MEYHVSVFIADRNTIGRPARLTGILVWHRSGSTHAREGRNRLANLTRFVAASFDEPGWDYGTSRGPYSKFHIANGAKYCVYNNRLMPVSQRIGRIDGYWALRTKAGQSSTISPCTTRKRKSLADRKPQFRCANPARNSDSLHAQRNRNH